MRPGVQSTTPLLKGGNNGNYNSSNNFNSNQPSLKDRILAQSKINESMTKKLAANDKSLESINAKIDGLSSALKVN